MQVANVGLARSVPLPDVGEDPRRAGRSKRRVSLAKFSIGVLIKKYAKAGLHVTPRVAELFLTDNCNLRCVSCACWREHTRNELTTDEWRAVIRQLAQIGIVKMNFTGGEALIRRDLIELVGHARRCGIGDLHLNSNGLLLDRSTVHDLLDAGIRSFNISIDGPTAAVHDGIRGRAGAFERTLAHLRYLIELRNRFDLRIRMSMTVLEPTVGFLEEVARLAVHLDVTLYLNLGTDQTFLFAHDDVAASIRVSTDDIADGIRPLRSDRFSADRRLPSPAELEYAKHFFGARSIFFARRDPECVESLLKLLVHSTGEVGGCWGETLDFNVREQSVASVLESAEYRREHQRLFDKDCVRCGSNYALNLRFDPRSQLYNLRRRLATR